VQGFRARLRPVRFEFTWNVYLRLILLSIRAHLLLSMTIDDEYGDEQTHEFECGADDTMSRCGVNSESKLFVKMDPESDDGDVA